MHACKTCQHSQHKNASQLWTKFPFGRCNKGVRNNGLALHAKSNATFETCVLPGRNKQPITQCSSQVKLEPVKLGLFWLEPVKLERLKLESMSAEVKAELLSQDEQEISQLLQRIKTEQTEEEEEEEEATQPGQSPTPYQSRPSQPDDWYDVLVMTADPEPSGPPVAADPEYGPPGTADPEYGPSGTADEGPSGPPAAQESLDDKIEEFGPSQRSSPPRRYNFNALMGYRTSHSSSDAETLPYDDQASESLSQGNTFRRFPSF